MLEGFAPKYEEMKRWTADDTANWFASVATCNEVETSRQQVSRWRGTTVLTYGEGQGKGKALEMEERKFIFEGWLEFDYVILVDVDAGTYRDIPSARRLLHVGATRAIHQLWLMTAGIPSPIVRGLRE